MRILELALKLIILLIIGLLINIFGIISLFQ